MGGEEDEGALHGGFEDVGECFIGPVVFGVQVLVARFFAQFVAFPGEELGRVGFLETEESDDLHDGCENGGRPETPAPGCVLGDETAGDGADGGAEERHEGVDTDGAASLLGVEAVA